MESAKEQAQSLHGSSDLSVGRVEKRRQELFAESKACKRCGKQGHLAAACPFREGKINVISVEKRAYNQRL